MYHQQKEVDYIYLLESGYTVSVYTVEELFELVYQLRENTPYPTRKKLIFILENLSNKHQLKIVGESLQKTNELVDELEKIIYTLVKR
jgi:hypothetical protein